MQLILADSILRAEAACPGAPAVVCGEVHLTYAELADRTRRLAGALAALGIKPGDRVAVLMHNCHRFLEAYLAIPWLGAVIVPLNTRHTVAEHRAILQDCAPRVILAGEEFVTTVAELSAEVDHILTDYEGALAASDPVPCQITNHEDDLAALFYTSGTSGAPRGVMLTHRNLVANAFNMTIGAGYSEREVFLHLAPMFHLADASSVYALTWQGACHVFAHRFEPGRALATIARERISCTIVVPTMLAALVEHPALADVDVSSLRLILHGGAPISSDLLRRAVAAFKCSFTQAYGLTESSALAAMLPHEEDLLDDPRIRSAGRAVMGVRLAVRRPDGSLCDPGEVGEITGCGPNFTLGYWNRPEQTGAAIRDGWLWTGDLAAMDAAGYLYIVDRKKDVIISGGENVYSVEVEEAVCAHPAVAEAAVIGVPDTRWGERVHAVVVVRPGHHVDAADLRAFCRQRIAGYKCPRSIDAVPAMPKSGAGKVLKRRLRAPYWSGRRRQVH